MTDDSPGVPEGPGDDGDGASGDSGPDGGSDHEPSDEQPGPLQDVRQRYAALPDWQSDALLIFGLLAGVWVLFGLFAQLQYLDVNGTVSTLQRVTFFAAVYGLVLLGLNIHWGYAGLFNIGVAGFMSVGVFSMAIVSGPEGVGFGLPIWLGVFAGIGAAMLLGAVAALPALRLRADYFAIVTLGIAEIVRLLFKSDWFDGHSAFGRDVGLGTGAPIDVPSPRDYVLELLTEDGNSGGEPTGLGEALFGVAESVGLQQTTVEDLVYTLCLILVVALVYWLVARVAASPFGRVLKAIREDETAARALGKHTNRAKIVSFMLGCGLMGLGGILWQAAYQGQASPDNFRPIVTFYIFVALIIGGAGSNTGSILGGIAFVGFLLEGPRELRRVVREHVDPPNTNTVYEGLTALGGGDPTPFLGYTVGNIESLQHVLLGVVLIVLMLRRPDGLLGHRKEIAAATDLSRPGGEDDE